MNDSTAVPAPPPQVFPTAPAPKKDQEDLNIEAYQRVFGKCIKAAEELVGDRIASDVDPKANEFIVDIAKEIFSRFYDDQNSMKQSKQQADAMIHGLSQMLEGRR